MSPATKSGSDARFWLVKTEPDVYSIDDLEKDRTTGWDGVRNHQARNFMRDDMKKGDQVLVHHSNAGPPGVIGVATVSREGHPIRPRSIRGTPISTPSPIPRSHGGSRSSSDPSGSSGDSFPWRSSRRSPDSRPCLSCRRASVYPFSP